jgi:C_GCAxxG_C_C family probable redox protein
MAVGQKKLGMEDARLVRAMTPMAGGMAASGGPCGALIGGQAFLGTVLGRDDPEAKDDPVMWKACFEFYKRFESEVIGTSGSIHCRDITGVDWSDREQARAFYKGDGAMRCANNTGKAAQILGEVIEKYLNSAKGTP